MVWSYADRTIIFFRFFFAVRELGSDNFASVHSKRLLMVLSVRYVEHHYVCLRGIA
jgi:hypothetical protein